MVREIIICCEIFIIIKRLLGYMLKKILMEAKCLFVLRVDVLFYFENVDYFYILVDMLLLISF